ncbi:hypothetical protein DdX_21057 [Ditylenchus destructor]|uniref:Uncharacterized protein n=1 Tax=Ditylenchus destructor TaxID=166010 RepID=A0AAD4MHW0_9BILA|nr:hypothetical protein DdX_21057 [Ditylenchus destructor]
MRRDCSTATISTMTRSMRRCRVGPDGDRDLRDRAGRRTAHEQRFALCAGHAGGRGARQRTGLRQDPVQAAQVGHEPTDIDPDRSAGAVRSVRTGAGGRAIRGCGRRLCRTAPRRPPQWEADLRRGDPHGRRRARPGRVRLSRRVPPAGARCEDRPFDGSARTMRKDRVPPPVAPCRQPACLAMVFRPGSDCRYRSIMAVPSLDPVPGPCARAGREA